MRLKLKTSFKRNGMSWTFVLMQSDIVASKIRPYGVKVFILKLFVK
jgi:hypothetical protein